MGEGDELRRDVRFECGVYAAGWVDAEPGCGVDCVAAMECVEQGRAGGFAPICPEFVIELRSPSDSLSELQAKMRLWVANGAEVAWLVDPARKTVEVYRPGREVEVVEGGSVVEGDGPVAGFVLELGRVWG